ncbi:GNAT family N-acetyltransferase [Nonomuraea antimicrobica]
MIELRAFEPADAATIVSWIDGLDTLVTWSGSVGFTWPFDAGQLLGFQAANPTRRFLVAADAAGSPVGSLTLRPDSDHSVRLGLVLVSPAARGRGHGRAMVEAALGTAFADPGCRGSPWASSPTTAGPGACTSGWASARRASTSGSPRSAISGGRWCR